MFMWELYCTLWFELKWYILFLISFVSILRALLFKNNKLNNKWQIGLLPIFGECGFCDKITERILLASAGVLYIISNGMRSWIVLLIGCVCGFYGEYLTVSKLNFHVNKVLYSICPFYRYWKWIDILTTTNSHKVKSCSKEIAKSNIRRNTDTTRINIDRI